MEKNNEHSLSVIEGYWRRHSVLYFQALSEVAAEKGGADYAFQVLRSSQTDSYIPNPGSIILMDSEFPGSQKETMERMDELIEQKRQRSISTRAHKAGIIVSKAIIRSFSFGLYPPFQ